MKTKVSTEIKAAAIADLLSGEQPAVVAERYALDRGMVKTWKQRHVSNVVTAEAPVVTTSMPPDDLPVTQQARPSIAARQAQVVELVYETLIAKLTATQRLAEHVTRDEWLDKQSAGGVAELGQWLDSTARATLELLARPAGDPPAE